MLGNRPILRPRLTGRHDPFEVPSFTMRRLLLASILLVACADDSPLRAPSSGSVRVSIAMAIAGQTGAAERSIAIRAFYRINGGGEVDLPVSPHRILLQSATTSERNLTVVIGACFDDELREQTSGEGCVLHVAVQLLGADGLSQLLRRATAVEFSDDARQQLGKGTCPTLVIEGDSGTPRPSLSWPTLLKHSEVTAHRLPGVGWLVPEDAPDRLSALLLGWLAGQRTR